MSTWKHILITVIVICLIYCLTGCADINQGILNDATARSYYGEWISPDGVHYWIRNGAMAPRYDSNGKLVMEE